MALYTDSTLYIDMDGTIAQFYRDAGCHIDFYNQGFFANLKPYNNVIDAIGIIQQVGIKTLILTAAPSDMAAGEKRQWCIRNIPTEINKNIQFISCPLGVRKKDWTVNKTLGKTDFLLDDYSKNLFEWEADGGTGIKFLNELNGRGWNGYNWDGPAISWKSSAKIIAEDICNIIRKS